MVFGLAALLNGCTREGCTDLAADNYDSRAEIDDGSCLYYGGDGLPIDLTGTITTATTIKDISTDGNVIEYYIDGTWKIDAAVVIEAGVRIEMRAGSKIHVTENGSLNATGESNNKINIVGAQDVAGFWSHIVFHSNNLNNKLIHCNISNGDKAYGINGMVTLKGSGQLIMQNTSLTKGGEYGLYLDNAANKLPDFKSNYLDEFGKSPMGINNLGQARFLDATTQFGSNNESNTIYVYGGSYNSAVSVPKMDLPYYLSSDFKIEGGHTTFEAGAEIVMAPNSGFTVTELASVKFAGTASQRVVLRGGQPTQGYWTNIVIQSNDLNNVFSYTDFSNGSRRYGADATIFLKGSGRLAMDNCSISASANAALDGADPNNYTDGGGNTYSNNAGGDNLLFP